VPVAWPALADAVLLGLVLLDPWGRVLHWNAWMTRYSGISAQAAIGRRLETIFPGVLPITFSHAVDNALRRSMPIVLSNVLHRSPLPLYKRAEDAAEDLRMPQSVTITPVITPGAPHLCLLQVTDTSVLAKRERVLISRSDKLSREALVDGLTGVYNRKYFDQKLRAELERAQRSLTPVSLIMLDVDCFKAYNDTYGHPSGDRVLLDVVQAAREQLNRATDVLARYGGEEFAVVLPASDKAGANLIAEKIRRAVEQLNIPHSASVVAPQLTVSLGVACHDSRMPVSGPDLLELADRALYDAKRSGRNRVRWVMSGASPLDTFPATQG
jgi:diguanylate cyclase (GGDEF)-like protein